MVLEGATTPTPWRLVEEVVEPKGAAVVAAVVVEEVVVAAPVPPPLGPADAAPTEPE